MLVNFTGKCLSSSPYIKDFVIMRKKSIICSCGLHEEWVNLFSVTLLASGNSLGSTCMLYCSWISLLLTGHLFPDQSLWNCISLRYFWKIDFYLFSPWSKQYIRKPWMVVTRFGPLNIMDMLYYTDTALHWFLFESQSCRIPSERSPNKEVSGNS